MKKLSTLTILLALLITTAAFSQQKKVIVDPKLKNTTTRTTQPESVRKITGKVYSEEKEALPGVTVKIKGKNSGTVTDANGNYELNNVAIGSTLEFSFVGMVKSTVSFGNQSVINVTMHNSDKELNEAVAIGYGTVRKSDLTGSVASVKSADLVSGTNTSVDNALSGKIPGVQVTQISGVPGSGATIRIRGSNSITANSEPLYVIDGVPYMGGGGANGLDSGTGTGSSTPGVGISPLSQINSYDIESIEVLKDASSTAIYGSRGANGVILITTKRGATNQKFSITYDSYFGIQQIAKKIELTNAMQYGELMNEYYDYTNQPSYKYPDINSLGVGTDWLNLLFKQGNIQNQSLSFRGGNKNSNYFFSFDYMNNDGIVLNSNFQRYDLRANFDTELTKWLKVGNSISVSRTTGNITSSGEPNNKSIISGALAAEPTNPCIVNGQYTLYVNDLKTLGNPVAQAVDIINLDIRNHVYGNFYGEIAILDGLKFKSVFGYDITSGKANYYAPRTVTQGNLLSSTGAPAYGSARIGTSNPIYWNSINTLTYQKIFNKIHRVDLLAGVSWEKNHTESTTITSTNFVTDDLLYNNVGSGTIQTVSSGASDWALQSYIGRVNYSLLNKYLFTATGRFDGSSVFGTANKYAFFPSFAIAWRANEESFLTGISWLSNLKVRLSDGSSGNQAISPYQSLSSLGSANVVQGNTILTGFVPTNMANGNLKWERTNQVDAGIDFGILNNRVSFSIDAYYKLTSDLLYNVPIPSISGYTSTLMNIGGVNNKGIELLLNIVPVDKKFKWDFTLNLAVNRNELLSLYNGVNTIISPPGSVNSADLSANPSILQVGQPLNSFYGYVFDGIFQNATDAAASGQLGAAPGELKIKDISGPNGVPDGKITTADEKIIGNANPDMTGGLINHFSYKQFELNFNLQWSIGGDIYDFQQMYMTNANTRNNFTEDFYKNRWTVANPNNHTPRAGYNPRLYPNNTYYIYDATYLRCTNAALAYNLPIHNKTIQNIKIYVSADNLFTFTNYPGFNPDASALGTNPLAKGVDIGIYPNAITYRVGFNIQL